MPPRYFCPRWGAEHIPWPIFIQQVRGAGYDGIEWAIPGPTSPTEIASVLSYGFPIIAQHYDSNTIGEYAAWIEKITPFSFYKINSQTGKDYLSHTENQEWIAKAAPGVIHETHRGKFSFAAHATMPYLKANANLRLTLDISHWVAVAESFLDDQFEAVQLAIEHTDHIHTRVGFPEGPQVPDPRLPEWQHALDIHLGWWKQVLSINSAVTFTCEFGPFPYLTHPLSQWDINLYMLEQLKRL